jgi:hypothetical protein
MAVEAPKFLVEADFQVSATIGNDDETMAVDIEDDSRSDEDGEEEPNAIGVEV